MGMGVHKESAGYKIIENLAEEISGRPICRVWSNWPKDMDGYREQNLQVKGYAAELLARHDRLIAFTEDHSLVSGIFSAFGAKPFDMTYIDSHPDFHTWTSSMTKKPHGMSLGTLCGMEGPYFKDLGGNVQNLQIIDGCEAEEAELKHLRELNYRLLRPDEFAYRGTAADNALSLDLDAIRDFKACNYHVGVMAYEEIKPIVEKLSDSRIIEISEFNPDNGYGDYEKRILHDLLETVIRPA
jgi:arginase family enzyme